jgi:hypothetical protein
MNFVTLFKLNKKEGAWAVFHQVKKPISDEEASRIAPAVWCRPSDGRAAIDVVVVPVERPLSCLARITLMVCVF